MFENLKKKFVSETEWDRKDLKNHLITSYDIGGNRPSAIEWLA